MNILHINMNFHNSKIHHNIVKIMNNQPGIDGRVFVPILKNEVSDNYIDFLDEVNCLSKIERYLFLYRNNHLTKIIEKTYELKNYDHIFAHSLFSNGYLAMSVAKKNNMDYSIIVTNTDMNVYFKKIKHLRKSGIKVLLNAKNIFFSSEAYKHNLIKKYIPKEYQKTILNKSTSIPFGIDDFWIENRYRKTERIINDTIRLLYVGKINKNKNLELTLRACKQLIRSGQKIQFTVVGNETDKYGAKILTNLKEESFVNYYRNVPFNELINFYRGNDIFVMPSIAESFGLVYAEALSQGMPIIYTKGQGFDKQFEDFTVGIPVHSESVEELVYAIKIIAENYKEISYNAFEKSIVFSWDKIAQRFLNTIVNNK